MGYSKVTAPPSGDGNAIERMAEVRHNSSFSSLTFVLQLACVTIPLVPMVKESLALTMVSCGVVARYLS